MSGASVTRIPGPDRLCCSCERITIQHSHQHIKHKEAIGPKPWCDLPPRAKRRRHGRPLKNARGDALCTSTNTLDCLLLPFPSHPALTILHSSCALGKTFNCRLHSFNAAPRDQLSFLSSLIAFRAGTYHRPSSFKTHTIRD